MYKKLTDSGAKGGQRADNEFRAKPYYDWHRTLDRRLWMSDVDSIEWRKAPNGGLAAVGVIEITRVDLDRIVSEQYLNEIIKRFEERDLQAQTARTVARALGTRAYIVLFRQDCSEFWVHDLTEGGHAWVHYDPRQMEDFLLSLQ